MDFSGLTDEQRDKMERRRSARMNTREEAATLQVELDQVRDELEFAKLKTDEATTERDDALASLEVAEGNVQKAALFGSQLLQRNNELESERDGFEAERNDLLQELEQNREANDGLLQTTRNLTLEKGRLADVIQSLEHDSTLDQSAIEELQQQHEAKVSNLSSEAKNALSLRREVDDHREELEAANARYANLESKNAALQSKLAAAGGGAEDLHLEIAALRQELKDAQESSNSDIPVLEAQLADAHKEYDELDKKSRGIRDTLMNRFADAQVKHEEEKERLVEHLDELKRDLSDVHERQGSAGSIHGFNTSLGAELGTLATHADLQQDLDDKKKSLVALEQQLEVATARIAKFESELTVTKRASSSSQSKFEQSRADLMSQLDAMAEQLKDADEAQGDQLRATQASHAEKRLLRDELDAAIESRAVIVAKLATVTQELVESREATESTYERLRAAESAAAAATEASARELQQMGGEVARLEKAVQDADQAATKVAARHAEKVESFEAARITHHEQVERLNKSITDLKAESHTAGREHATKLRETSESLLEAQKALAAAHQTASEMETALQTAQSDLTKARAEMVHLQDREAELTSVDALHKTQLADLKDAREEARAKTEEARELAQQLDELKKTAAAAEAKVGKLEVQLADEVAEKDRLSAVLSDEKRRYATAAAALKEAKSSRSKAEAEAEHARVKAEALVAQVTALEQGQVRTSSEAEDEVQKLHLELKGLRDTIVEQDALLRETTEGYDEVVAELEAEIRDREEKIGAIERELQKMLVRAHDLQSESEREDAADKVLRDKVAAAEKKMFVAQDELAFSQKEVKELKVVATAATAEHIRLKKRLDEVEAQLQNVQQDRDRKQAEIRSGTKALAEVNAKEEALHDEIDELKIQLEDLTGRCEDLEDDLDEKEKEHEEVLQLMAIESDAVIDVLKTEIDIQTAAVDTLTFENGQLKEEIARLRAKLAKDGEGSQSLIETQRTELHRLTTELKLTLAACAEANESLTRTIEKLTAKSDLCDDLQKAVDASSGLSEEKAAELKSSATRHRAEMEALTARCEQLKLDNGESVQRAVKAEDDLAAGGKVYQELKAARSELAEKLDTVTENLEEAKAENETLLGEVNDLMALNSDLAREQMELRDVSDAKEADWELQRTALEGALASLRIDLDAASDASASVQTAKANKALKPQLEALQLKLKTFEEKNRALKEEHKELDDEHTAVLDEVNELMALNQELRDELQTLRDDHGGGGTAAVTGLGGLESLSTGGIRQGELEDEAKSLRREVDKFKTAEARAKNDVRQGQARERALAEEITELKQNVEDLVEEVDDLMAINQELRDEAASRKEGGMDAVGVSDGLLGSKGAAGVRNELSKMDLGEARQEIQHLKGQLKEKEAECDQLRVVANQAAVDRDAAAKSESESSKEVDVLMGFMSELNDELKRLKHQRASAGVGIDAATSLLGLGSNVQEAALKAELEAMEAQIESLSRKTDDLEDANTVLTSERDDIAKKLAKARDDQAHKFIELEDEIELLTEENEELVDFLKKVNGELEKAKAEKGVLEQKMAAEELEHAASLEEHQSGKGGLAKLSSAKATMAVLADSLREDLKVKEAEKRDMHLLLEEAHRKLKETEHQLKAAAHTSTRVKLNLEKERVAHEKTRKKLTHLPDDGEKSRGKNLLSAPPPKQVPLAPDAKPADMASFFANMQHSTRKSGTTAPT